MKLKTKIFIVDFDDSFTYNIANIIYPFCAQVEVVHHLIFFNKTMSELKHCDDRLGIILGPGPGHPKVHQKYFLMIEQLRMKENIFLMGVCLGHQMLGLIDGLAVKKAQVCLHGLSDFVWFKNKKRKVYRYNSLAVYQNKNKNKKKEIPIRYFERGLSMQFHPESIGTDNPEVYFEDLFEFLDRSYAKKS